MIRDWSMASDFFASEITARQKDRCWWTATWCSCASRSVMGWDPCETKAVLKLSPHCRWDSHSCPPETVTPRRGHQRTLGSALDQLLHLNSSLRFTKKLQTSKTDNSSSSGHWWDTYLMPCAMLSLFCTSPRWMLCMLASKVNPMWSWTACGLEGLSAQSSPTASRRDARSLAWFQSLRVHSFSSRLISPGLIMVLPARRIASLEDCCGFRRMCELFLVTQNPTLGSDSISRLFSWLLYTVEGVFCLRLPWT